MILYPYQQHVKELIQAGRSVILQAPTGAGKTCAALAPFIESFFDQPAEFFPRKCIYSVPMRILANQFKEEYDKFADPYKRIFGRNIEVSIQTGDHPDDTKLEGNLIFATVDQTLSNFLNIPYSLGKGSANLNAGAIISSYLVFDELHLYDPDVMLPSILGMLRWLRGTTPFIVMTATFSTNMLKRLADALDAVIVPEDEKARVGMQDIGTQIGKQRIFQRCDTTLTAKEVLHPERRGQRVICICNTVERAQKLFQDLTEELKAKNDKETLVRLIHSRFYKNHRDDKEKWIREQFSLPQTKYDGIPLILVATQVVEVGVNATCDVLHTELAPAASILQRAGRCARFEHENGRVFVYLPQTKDGEPDYTPYFLKKQSHKTERGKRLCESTWQALALPQFQNTHMSFSLEQDLIDAVHTPIDAEILDAIQDNERGWLENALTAMREQEQGLASELIRNVNTRFVIVHPNPKTDENLTKNPWCYDGFALQPTTLYKAYKDAKNLDVPWIMQEACRLADSVSDEETPAHQTSEYKWVNLTSENEVFAGIALAVHPQLAQYDEELGLRFEWSNLDEVKLYKRRKKWQAQNYSYHRETYAEHIAGLYKAYTQPLFDKINERQLLALVEEVAYTLRKIENGTMEKQVNLDQVIRAMFACHDLGKLSTNWQKWAHIWQKRIGLFHNGMDMSLPKDYMAAHTDFDASIEQKEAQQKLGKRPNHAGESAMAAADLIWTACSENKAFWSATITAIARHHHAATDSYTPFKYHPHARHGFVEALKEINLDSAWAEKVFVWTPDGTESLRQLLVDFTPAAKQTITLYFLLSRILRLADQRSQTD